MGDDSISIVVPTYNRAAMISRALGSLLPQCAPGDEVIVVDDGSTDDTEAVVSSFPGVRFVRCDHGGAGRARNAGIRLAKHSLVGFLDSDDELLPGSIACRRALMTARQDLVFCFTNFAGQFQDGTRVPAFAIEWHQDPRGWDAILGPGEPLSRLTGTAHDPDPSVHIGDLYRDEMRSNYVAANTLLVRRELAGDALRYAEDLSAYEDWECFGRLSGKGPCAFLAFDSSVQHEHGGPRITDFRIDERIRCRLTVLDRIWGRDEAFLARHRDEYLTLCDEQRLLGAKWLLYRDRTPEARELLQDVRRKPWWAALAMRTPLPGLALGALKAIRRLRAPGGAAPRAH